jgi:hypothetical protein
LPPLSCHCGHIIVVTSLWSHHHGHGHHIIVGGMVVGPRCHGHCVLVIVVVIVVVIGLLLPLSLHHCGCVVMVMVIASLWSQSSYCHHGRGSSECQTLWHPADWWEVEAFCTTV